MSKHFSKKRRLKYVLLALTCAASFTATGLAACAKEPDDKEEENKTSAVDNQLLKNGNFEYFDVPAADKDGKEPVYLINSPNNWTHGGTSSYTMSGIIDTNKTAWDLLSADDLAEKLDINNALNSNDSNYKDDYVDYNGLKSSDLLYKDSYSALKTGSITSTEVDGKTEYKLDDKTVYLNDADGEYYFTYKDGVYSDPLKAKLDNPGTHYNVENDADGYYYMDGETRVPVYKDDNGDYFLKYDETTGEYSETFSNVLMLHNYSSSSHNGIAQNYTSISLSLPANTAAEISVWVKTSDLLFRQGTSVTQDRGAYIAVSHTVGGASLGDFKISCINTEKLIGDNPGLDKYNGWVQYTLYVNGCDFADSNISIKLGLGETNYAVEGYAFFDDVKVTRFADLSDEGCSYDESAVADNAKCYLSSTADEKNFIADKYVRNDGEITDVRSSENFRYLLDLASEDEYAAYKFADKNLTAGLTVDGDKYVSSTDTSKITYIGNGLGQSTAQTVKLPEELKKLNGGKGLDTSDDLIAFVNSNYRFQNVGGEKTAYAQKLNSAIESAGKLPKADNYKAEDSSVIVMLSARGAAYTASFDLNVDSGKRVIVSFWIKTSDMEGNTAATVTLKDKGDEDISTNFTIDTTDMVTDIDDNLKDIYNGWVQCFFFVENNDTQNKDGRQLSFELSFGNTAISDTAVSSYSAGWVALANLQTLEINEKTYGYTSTGDYAKALTLNDNEVTYTNAFDEPLGNLAHEIENGMVDPTNYYGVNGGSSFIKNNGSISLPYDDKNQKIDGEYFAGLINKEYAENYGAWYDELMETFDPSVKSMTTAIAKWNKVFGQTAYQPLVILNRFRTVDGKKVNNYGFIGNDSSASADGYSVVSVKVMVSAGAVAHVYLADTSAGKKVLSFNTPSYSFYYDEDGNVLYKELDDDATLADRKANVLYTLRSDGLYEDKDGKLFANTWNYTKLYKDESASYFDKNGELVSFEDLVKGETYYADKTASENKLANHFLVTSDGAKVFEYKDGAYYYIVDGKTQDKVITPFDINNAKYTEVSAEYKAVVDARYSKDGVLMKDGDALGYDKDGNYVAGKWVTVSFIIHTGSAAKNYRLELWSGEREKSETDMKANSAVVFDYSYTTATDDTLKNWYESEIIKAYKKVLSDKNLLDDKTLASSEENISYYEALIYGGKLNGEEINGFIKDGKLSEADLADYTILNNYKAHYYTFSLYDSNNFRPFNADTADENTTGYDYKLTDYSETLAYLEVKDYTDDSNAYTVFVDYSAVDQTIEFVTSDGDTDDDETEEDNTNVWLLVSSILLVVALLFAMLSILIKDLWKKKRRNKVTSKNNYNHNKAVRKMKRLKIQPEEFEEVDLAADENADGVEPEEIAEQPAEAEPEVTEDAPAEEIPDSEEPDEKE